METELKKVWVTMEPITEGEKIGWSAPTGFHLTEPENWCCQYTVVDPEEFIAHMRRYSRLPKHALSREEYELLCSENGVELCNDDDLDNSGMEYGDFGMSHYHTDPANRKTGIAYTIHQLRYRSLKDEFKRRKEMAPKPVRVPDYPEGLKLGCGCVVYSKMGIMQASMGTSCPDCYDRMSD